MKKTLTFILMFMFLFYFGCASDRTISREIDNDFIREISKQEDISVGLVFKFDHYGSTSGYPFQHSRTFRQGTIQGTIPYRPPLTSEEIKYAFDLGRKSCEVIEDVIDEGASFHLKHEKFKNIPRQFFVEVFHQDEWDEQRQKKQKEVMAQFIESNALSGALLVKASYTVSGVWKKKMVLSTRWTMYGRDGDVTASITTIYHSEKAEEVFPNTLDSRYEETYVNLSKISAENFVKALMSDN